MYHTPSEKHIKAHALIKILEKDLRNFKKEKKIIFRTFFEITTELQSLQIIKTANRLLSVQKFKILSNILSKK